MTNKNEHCGVFGKLPQQADYISHHLPDTYTETWHQWLQACISVSREQLGDSWLDRYIISPVWNFALMPGIVAEEAIVGVVIPSVDQIGRYYPLTIVHAGNHDIWSAFLYGQDWYQQAQTVALSALRDETNFSEFIGLVETLSPPDIAPLTAYASHFSSAQYAGSQVYPLQGQDKHIDLALSLLPKAYQQQLGNHGIWWTNGSDTFDARFVTSKQLPDPGQYAAFLDGEWQSWGWQEELPIESTPIS